MEGRNDKHKQMDVYKPDDHNDNRSCRYLLRSYGWQTRERWYTRETLAFCGVCSMLMKRLGIRWNLCSSVTRRNESGKLKVTSPDPLYILKRERVEELKKSQVRDID